MVLRRVGKAIRFPLILCLRMFWIDLRMCAILRYAKYIGDDYHVYHTKYIGDDYHVHHTTLAQLY